MYTTNDFLKLSFFQWVIIVSNCYTQKKCMSYKGVLRLEVKILISKTINGNNKT